MSITDVDIFHANYGLRYFIPQIRKCCRLTLNRASPWLAPKLLDPMRANLYASTLLDASIGQYRCVEVQVKTIPVIPVADTSKELMPTLRSRIGADESVSNPRSYLDRLSLWITQADTCVMCYYTLHITYYTLHI
jgi:hypothetical protein